MATLKQMGHRLEEAVRRQGQVLPTENESWGFYGTLSQSMPDTIAMNDLWIAAFKAFLEVFPGIDSKVVREFLDSKGGRMLADSVIDDLQGKGDAAKVGKGVKAALRGREGSWVAKDLARLAGTPMGVAPGGTAELAQNVKAVTVAFASVQAEEAKKNWKQQADAMHTMEKAADALVTATRAWFSNSGRATAHEVWKGAGQKVRVTIPEGAAAEGAPLQEESREAAQFTLQMNTVMTMWDKIEHLRSRIYGTGTPYDAKNKKERDAMNAEHDETVEAIEAGLKNAVKLFASWKAG